MDLNRIAVIPSNRRQSSSFESLRLEWLFYIPFRWKFNGPLDNRYSNFMAELSREGTGKVIIDISL